MTLPTDSDSGLRLEIDLSRQQVTLHVTPENIANLRGALDGAERGGKVILGDPGGPVLIVRPVGWK